MKIKTNCKECRKEFEGLRDTNSKNYFCSRSCSVRYNNKKKAKRKPEHKCLKCGVKINAKRKHCEEHFKEWLENQCKDMTLKEAIYKKHHRSNAYSLIRGRARTIAKNLNMNFCEKCGYNKHVEICHKKPISQFSDDVLISIINSPDNLIALCPNCHWEFDNIKSTG